MEGIPAIHGGGGSQWTRKEAVVKATGDGIGGGPATLAVTPPDTAPRLLSCSGRSRNRGPVRYSRRHDVAMLTHI
ncbi:hypothetical protein GCM10027605_49460 [Micromonospora zhanjiangensis]